MTEISFGDFLAWMFGDIHEIINLIKWKRINSIYGASKVAPNLPGIYALGSVETNAKLPLGIEWIYIGKTKDLSTRLSQHEPLTESNVELRILLSKYKDNIEVWYTILDNRHLNSFEKYLIREINPLYNKIKYIQKEHRDD